ncbi:hypothetical protein BDV25DRAFT_14651 [Aspergillus avenaceus]|uniref:Uncharacterized protein n=1 Tax=Aspergillus avenaceus TaxID=36643 RepID=A0A5N6U5B5_ASPAV|nr:hypothetical protein BDV25DRAFT_14651 [Aspergillus avenaceus]
MQTPFIAALLLITQLAAAQGTNDCAVSPAIIIDFSWHNSTRNCGCDDGGCLPTGLPGGPGCGPPDTVQATFQQQSAYYNDSLTCGAWDPGSVPAREIPGGPFNCRSLGRRFSFGVNGTEATINYVEPNFLCANGRAQVTYEGSFSMDCVSDSYGNSTCVQHDPTVHLNAMDINPIH